VAGVGEDVVDDGLGVQLGGCEDVGVLQCDNLEGGCAEVWAFEDKVVQGRALPTLGDDVIKHRLYKTPGHWRNFLDCAKSRQPTVTPVETAHHSAIPGHLSLIALMTNSVVKWDPEKEVILENEAASKLLGSDYRSPWKLPA
jgi:hypothetical protein